MDFWTGAAAVGVPLAGLGLGFVAVRRRNLDRWLFPYLRQAAARAFRKPAPAGRAVHVLLCVADHYEPYLGGVSPDVARRRVARWSEDYPKLCARFRDSDGRPPRYSFFYPEEEYEPEYLDALADICRAGLGEVEVHLHHDNDTAESLRRKLEGFKRTLVERHGLLSRDRHTGEAVYGFIHGNWALDNSRPDGRMCGVNNELDVLRETGCYADFTLPSAPNPTQTRKINSLYYARGRPGRCKSHDTGVDVGRGPVPDRALLLIQGPLLLNWGNRKWGLLPRLENGCLQGTQAPTLARLDLWLKARVQVPARPDWFFVKLYTHGANEANMPALLGEPMARFHENLAGRAVADPQFHYHYVTAREMYNLVRAAEAGWTGSVAEARDYQLVFNGCRPAPLGTGEQPAGSQAVGVL
jgi:hypothetical protein